MAYTNVWVTSLLLRFVLPLVFAGCIVLRPSGLSFLYLLLFLYIPFVPVPSPQSFRGHTGRFLRVCVFISFSTVIAQIVFQIVLLSLAPYGSFLTNCEFLETFLRHIGLVKINYLKWVQLLRWLGPDVVALTGTLITYISISNILEYTPPAPPCDVPGGVTAGAGVASSKPRKSDQSQLSGPPASAQSSTGSRVLSAIGTYLVLALLCFTSSLQPSLPSAFYYVIFLLGATCWALCLNIKNKIFAGIFVLTTIVVCAHIIALFLYQLQWAQELILPESLEARLSGLVPLFLTNCEFDPRDTQFNLKLGWASFVHPGALLALFHLLVYEIKTLLSPQEKLVRGHGPVAMDAAKAQFMSRGRVGSLTGDLEAARLNRRQTVRWQGGKSSRRDWTEISTLLVGSISNLAYVNTPRSSTQNTESTPLMTFSAPRPRYSQSSGGGRSYSGDGASALQMNKETSLLSRGQSITSKESAGVVPGGSNQQSPLDGVGEEPIYDGYGLLLAGLFSIFEIFAKSSYVATNIIMMAWSITYHSWLTFVLLLWACVLWMFPNQRKAMLYSSPGLVLYAELLLLAQFVYSLNLTDEELPQKIDNINLEQVGLIKTQTKAYLPILVKSLYTVMFWITLKQFVLERREKKASIEEAAQEPFRITVSTTATGAPISELKQIKEEGGRKKPNYMMKVGTFVRILMTKFWIWVVAIMLFVIGLGGEEVVLYRIVYMALFLIFILTFQLSYGFWRKMMYGFWLTVIVYSMLVLVLIYTYQFQYIPEYLSNYTGIPDQLQKDIGLEIYDTGSLFVRLLTPTFFVVITVVQLHYFHKDFLKLSDISRGEERRRDVSHMGSIEEEEPPALIDVFNFNNFMKNLTFYGAKFMDQVSKIYTIASDVAWRFLDIHITKIVLFSAFMLSVNDTCALHFVLFAGVVCAMAVSSSSIQRMICHLCSIYISVLLLAKMIYQIDYIKHEAWDTNCTIQHHNITRNDADWLGLTKVGSSAKAKSLPSLLKGYIGMILVLMIQAVVQIRQRFQNRMISSTEPMVGVLFPGIHRKQADKDILNCIQYLFNYCFYKFGVEFTLVTMVVVIGTRLDVFSVLYSFWLIPMFCMKRVKLARIWLPFIAFVAVLLPIQYLSCVGLPPMFCAEYPWETWANFGEELNVWLFLPDVSNPPMASRLISDFFLLLFACQQQVVFWVERSPRADEFPGGNNEESTVSYIHPSENPVPDFLTVSKTWLDLIKRCIFLSFYWITLAIIFLAATNRVNLFALGYLIGSFIFLWEGNEFYLRSRRSITKRWNYLLAYNVFVVFSKSILQLVGCVFASDLQYNFCWVVQLFGIACLKFGNRVQQPQGSQSDVCPIPHGEAGLMWDGITFAFLLLMRRLFNSYYFFHIVCETEAQHQLASRGAELIGNLMHKQIQQQDELEKEVLEKIKMKMDRIKATHQKGGTKELNNHFDASSMVSSQMSDDAPGIETEAEPPASPLAPLAVPQSTGITSGTESAKPTPTPSSAAMTISYDGFFEPPYGHHRRDSLLHPPVLPLSPSDESFPVFSPPPYNDNLDLGRRTAGVQTIAAHAQARAHAYPFHPQQQRKDKDYYNAPLQSPVLSHHTSIRSGDYYMFDEYEDEELEMIDSITEEEEDGESDRPMGVTVSELMANALKTGDFEAATEMARLARQGSELKDGSLTESTAGTSSAAAAAQLSRRRKSRRLSRKSFSFKRDRLSPGRGGQGHGQGQDEDQDLMPAPLASDGEGTSSAADDHGHGGGHGGDRRLPSTSTGGFGGSMDGDEGDEDHDGAGARSGAGAQPQQPTFMRRVFGYLRFSWAFLESVMISMTAYLNRLSKDYRHVSRCLSEEKLLLKERELALGPQPQMQPPQLPLLVPEPLASLIIDRKGSIDEGVDPLTLTSGTDTRIDLTKQLSTEESEEGQGGSGEGDIGSKDDLLTVVERPSPEKEKAEDLMFDVEGSLDEVSLSEVSEKEYPPILLLMTAIWYVVISHSDLLCYFVIFINQINSASILSLPLPLMVLLWGSLSVPRPTKTFWVTIIAYTEAIVVIKYLFQFDFFLWDNKLTKGPFTPAKILGVEKDAKYAMFDVPLLMVVFFHRFMLKSLGLWKNKGSEDEKELTVYLSEEKEPMNPKSREASNASLGGKNGGQGQGDPSSALTSSAGSGDEEQLSVSQTAGCAPHWDQQQLQESLAYGPTILKLCLIQYLSSMRLFFEQILNSEYKVKVDVYSFMFMCDFFNFLVLIFGFAAFGSGSGDVSSYLEDNKVPVPFLVLVILQFALIVIDRALYLRKYILGKFFFQIILVTLVHISMFFLLPAYTERNFNAALPPQMWYMVKCIYLLFSAYQIRSGYPTRILGNFLCKKYNYVNMFLFKGFMLVPFLFELRALMDWIWTDTSMTLSDWLKLEDIFAHVFQLKCQRRVEKEYPQGRGMPKARWSKYAIGGSSLFIIIAIIWFPLVLFALGNTVGVVSRPNEISIEIAIGSYQPIFTMSAQNNSLKTYSLRDWDSINKIFRNDKKALTFLDNYDYEDIVVGELNGNSDAIWGISPPSKTNLLEELNNNTVPVIVRLSWTISRDTGLAKSKHTIELPPGDPNRAKLVAMINGSPNETVILHGIFPKFLKVSGAAANNKAAPPNDLLFDKPASEYLYRDLDLTLKSGGLHSEWWDVEEVCNKRPPTDVTPLPQDSCDNMKLNLFTFNDKAFPSSLTFLSGGGIIGLYTTLVLVASKFVRGFFSGISFLIMFDDMPNVDRLFQLCLDIYLVRESKELALEEDLFAKLIFLYRSPETLIKWTRPKRIPIEGGPEQGQGDGPRAIQQ